MTTDPKQQAREATAEFIADRLFRNGLGSMAERLVLELPGKRDGGGWCKRAVINVISDALREREGL